MNERSPFWRFFIFRHHISIAISTLWLFINAYGTVTSGAAVLTDTNLSALATYALPDFYYPLSAGNHWEYNSQEGSSAWSTDVRIGAVNLPLVIYTGRNPVSSYQRPVAEIVFDQGDIPWTNYMSSATGQWGIWGSDDGSSQVRFDGGFIVTNKMTVGEAISHTNDIYVGGVFAGTAVTVIELIGMENANVPAGNFSGCLHIKQTSTIGSRIRVDDMWWAKGVGPVKWTHGAPGASSVELNELRTMSVVLSNGPLRFITANGGISNGTFQTRLTGAVNARIIVEASANSIIWAPVSTNMLPADGLLLSIPIDSNKNQFYRAKLMP
jgi:hypothetical protein